MLVSNHGTKTGEAEPPRLGNAQFRTHQSDKHSLFGLIHSLAQLNIWVITRQNGMGYGVSGSYGLCSEFPRIPNRDMENPMGYMGVWLIRDMAYEGVDCMSYYILCSLLTAFNFVDPGAPKTRRVGVAMRGAPPDS